MERVKALISVYKIEEVLIHLSDRVEIVISKRNESLSMSRWIDFSNELKSIFNKEVDFLTLKDANFIYQGDLSCFDKIGGNEYE